MDAIQFDPGRKIIVVKVRRETIPDRGGMYEAVRRQWRLDPRRAEEADLVLGAYTDSGECFAAFVPERWIEWECSVEESKRYQFFGHEADPEEAAKYLGKRIPDSMRRRGAANPVCYSWPKSGRKKNQRADRGERSFYHSRHGRS